MNILENLIHLTSSAATGQTDDLARFRQHVTEGLQKTPKQLSSMYFYDAEGSRLFRRIMDLPEYYLTRTEFGILEDQKTEITGKMQGSGFFHLIDLGAGDALKTRILLKQLSRQRSEFEYIPVDISQDAMEDLLKNLQNELPEIPVQAIASDYFTALNWLQIQKTGRKVVLFLGSNIGNFEKQEAADFLKSIRKFLMPGDNLFIGFDLRKDPVTIRQAYDDSAGVTAAFNLNLLHRINNELQADFDVSNFKHFTDYDPIAGVMKSYLISTSNQTVTLNNQPFTFKAWEAIHTENSFKYDLDEIHNLAQTCNFTIQTVFTDAQQQFADVLLAVK